MSKKESNDTDIMLDKDVVDDQLYLELMEKRFKNQDETEHPDQLRLERVKNEVLKKTYSSPAKSSKQNYSWLFAAAAIFLGFVFYQNQTTETPTFKGEGSPNSLEYTIGFEGFPSSISYQVPEDGFLILLMGTEDSVSNLGIFQVQQSSSTLRLSDQTLTRLMPGENFCVIYDPSKDILDKMSQMASLINSFQDTNCFKIPTP